MRRSARRVLAAAALILSGCAIKPLPNEMGSPKYGIDVTWHGQSCFTLKDSIGRMIVIDPFDPTVGFGNLRLLADALLITHEHFDHNYRQAVHAHGPEIDLIDSTGTATVASGMVVIGIASAHDAEQGQVNGPNTIYAFRMGGLRCVHMGDFGQLRLTDFQRKMIGAVDVLFIPVGGSTTIGPNQAKMIVDQLRPGAVFPMHYGDVRFFKFQPVEDFTGLFPADQVRRVDSSTVRIRPTDLTDRPIVYILSPQNHN